MGRVLPIRFVQFRTAELKREPLTYVKGSMKPRQLNAFADHNLDPDIKRAIARDLQRMWSSLLAGPLPPNLQQFISQLELAERRQGRETSN